MTAVVGVATPLLVGKPLFSAVSGIGVERAIDSSVCDCGVPNVLGTPLLLPRPAAGNAACSCICPSSVLWAVLSRHCRMKWFHWSGCSNSYTCRRQRIGIGNGIGIAHTHRDKCKMGTVSNKFLEIVAGKFPQPFAVGKKYSWHANAIANAQNRTLYCVCDRQLERTSGYVFRNRFRTARVVGMAPSFFNASTTLNTACRARLCSSG